MYCYTPSHEFPGQFEVGYYHNSAGNFVRESVQPTAADAAARVSYLNGGSLPA